MFRCFFSIRFQVLFKYTPKERQPFWAKQQTKLRSIVEVCRFQCLDIWRLSIWPRQKCKWVTEMRTAKKSGTAPTWARKVFSYFLRIFLVHFSVFIIFSFGFVFAYLWSSTFVRAQHKCINTRATGKQPNSHRQRQASNSFQVDLQQKEFLNVFFFRLKQRMRQEKWRKEEKKKRTQE